MAHYPGYTVLRTEDCPDSYFILVGCLRIVLCYSHIGASSYFIIDGFSKLYK